MAIGSKIIKPGGSDPDDFEKSIAQALVELEANSDLKPYLRDLHITRAREIEFGSKKVNSIWRTCGAFNSNQLTHSLHAGKCLSFIVNYNCLKKKQTTLSRISINTASEGATLMAKMRARTTRTTKYFITRSLGFPNFTLMI